jgi:uncharacterized membrane protein YcaP (DUF421 family)
MRRRFRAPGTFVVLVLLAVGPIAAAAGLVSNQAATTTLHVALAFGAIMAVFRVIGKRELGRLSPFELVTLMLVPEIVSEVVQGNGDLSSSLIGLSTLFMLVLLTSLLSHRFEAVQQIMESPPTLLVADGRLLEQNMNRERIAPEEVIAEMHKQGIERLADVKWAILESSGNITYVAAPNASTTPAGSNDDSAP